MEDIDFEPGIISWMNILCPDYVQTSAAVDLYRYLIEDVNVSIVNATMEEFRTNPGDFDCIHPFHATNAVKKLLTGSLRDFAENEGASCVLRYAAGIARSSPEDDVACVDESHEEEEEEEEAVVTPAGSDAAIMEDMCDRIRSMYHRPCRLQTDAKLYICKLLTEVLHKLMGNIADTLSDDEKELGTTHISEVVRRTFGPEMAQLASVNAYRWVELDHAGLLYKTLVDCSGGSMRQLPPSRPANLIDTVIKKDTTSQKKAAESQGELNFDLPVAYFCLRPQALEHLKHVLSVVCYEIAHRSASASKAKDRESIDRDDIENAAKQLLSSELYKALSCDDHNIDARLICENCALEQYDDDQTDDLDAITVQVEEQQQLEDKSDFCDTADAKNLDLDMIKLTPTADEPLTIVAHTEQPPEDKSDSCDTADHLHVDAKTLDLSELVPTADEPLTAGTDHFRELGDCIATEGAAPPSGAQDYADVCSVLEEQLDKIDVGADGQYAA